MMRRRPGSLADRRILLTGGSSGIGLTTAERLVAAGARVVLVARGEAGLADASARLGRAAEVIAADVRDPDDIARAVTRAAALPGGLDAVVADAAAAAYGPFVEMAVEDYRATVESTLLGALHTAHAALPHLAPRGGTLVFVGSVAGRAPVPWLAAYTAGKHGVRGFARSLAAELRALRIPVRIALVHPGPVNTRFWKRVRTPDGRLPPTLHGAYSPETVAIEIERALRGQGPLERTVGGVMAIAERVDALAPNTSLHLISAGARLGWRGRERRPPQEGDALVRPAAQAERDGGLIDRRSLLTTARGRLG